MDARGPGPTRACSLHLPLQRFDAALALRVARVGMPLVLLLLVLVLLRRSTQSGGGRAQFLGVCFRRVFLAGLVRRGIVVCPPIWPDADAEGGGEVDGGVPARFGFVEPFEDLAAERLLVHGGGRRGTDRGGVVVRGGQVVLEEHMRFQHLSERLDYRVFSAELFDEELALAGEGGGGGGRGRVSLNGVKGGEIKMADIGCLRSGRSSNTQLRFRARHIRHLSSPSFLTHFPLGRAVSIEHGEHESGLTFCLRQLEQAL